MKTKEERLQEIIDKKNPLKKIMDSVTIMKGDKGEPGEPGYTPIKGRDYFTEREVDSIISYVQARVRPAKDGKDGKDGKNGKNGEDAVVNYDKILREVLAKIPKPKDGKDADIDLIIKKVSEKIPRVNYKEEIGKILNTPGFKMLLHGGGLTSVSHDGTLSGSGTISDPLTVISGGAETFLDLTDTPDSYTGAAGKVVSVKGDESGLEFTVSTSSDEKVKYDAGDPTAGYIADKIIAGTGISVAEGTGGDANKLVITNTITAGANTALSNLAAVAINTSLISDTDSTDDLGSSSKFWANTYTDTLYFSETTSSTAGLIFQGTDRFIHSYGTHNVFIGKNSGNFTTTGTGGNVGIGENSLVAVTSGYYNGALGFNALAALTSGTGNFAIGPYALSQLTTGTNNMCIGSLSGQYTTNSGNVFVGSESGRFNDGGYNIALGTKALSGQSSSTKATGSYNIALGLSSLENSTSGERNMAMGYYTLNDLTTGIKNVAIGMFAGRHTTGSGNVLLGNEAGMTDVGSNKLVITNVDTTSPLIGGDFSTGRVGVGVGLSPSAILHLKAGTATSSTASLKIDAGILLATTEAGAIENDGTHLYYTAANGGTRYQLDQQVSPGGGITRTVETKSSDATAGATASTDYVYFVTGTTTITMPTAVGNTNRYTLIHTDTNIMTIATTSSQTIAFYPTAPATTATVSRQGTVVELFSDGANWWTI